jgi:hypothetical protein
MFLSFGGTYCRHLQGDSRVYVDAEVTYSFSIIIATVRGYLQVPELREL